MDMQVVDAVYSIELFTGGTGFMRGVDVKGINLLLKLLSPNASKLTYGDIHQAALHGTLAVAKCSGETVGMAMLAVSYTLREGHFGLIRDIVVEPAHRMKGVEIQLIEALKEEGKRLTLAHIETVRPESLSHWKFEGLGFRFKGWRQFFRCTLPKESAE